MTIKRPRRDYEFHVIATGVSTCLSTSVAIVGAAVYPAYSLSEDTFKFVECNVNDQMVCAPPPPFPTQPPTQPPLPHPTPPALPHPTPPFPTQPRSPPLINVVKYPFVMGSLLLFATITRHAGVPLPLMLVYPFL